VNRKLELEALAKLEEKPGLVVVFGRRRHGKTRFLREWLNQNGGHYAQAIEGSGHLQLTHLVEDLQNQIGFPVPPQNWSQFFQLMDSFKDPMVICIDEFPYLVQSNSSLPSLFQKWWDQRKNKKLSLILCGSSRSMMDEIFLTKQSPLFGRAVRQLNIGPMGYADFCKAVGVKPEKEESFLLFSLTGGIPKYWELLDTKKDVVYNADELFFSYSAMMENEPSKWLEDDQINGTMPLSILEVIGRGAHRPSEIATRINTKQANLTRVFDSLAEFNFIKKEVPFGDSLKNTKRTIYNITDPTLKFWFIVFSVHRSRWQSYPLKQKYELIRVNASHLFEQMVRSHFNALRYWQPELELDLVYEENKVLHVGEVKFKYIKEVEKRTIIKKMENHWCISHLSKKWPNPSFEIYDLHFLSQLK
jgi:AAA+ ATPase superfamily predicted ATPase